jgi:integral membrane protein
MTTSATTHETGSANKQLKLLTIVGYTEGFSFLLLLGIAMPLKYMMGFPAAVKWIGMAHGILFLGYLVVLLATAVRVKLPIWAVPCGVIAAVMPFGPFVFDHLLKKHSGGV